MSDPVCHPHQATAVAIGARAVLIEGPPGAGKSDLALALIDRGAQLIGDDGILLRADAHGLTAHPHPNTHGLLEVRNLGLLSFPVVHNIPVALVVRLDDAAPRYVDGPDTVALLGRTVPCLRLKRGMGQTAIKVELALDRFGLPMPPPSK